MQHFCLKDVADRIRKIKMLNNNDPLLLSLEFLDDANEILYKSPYKYSSSPTETLYELGPFDRIVGFKAKTQSTNEGNPYYIDFQFVIATYDWLIHEITIRRSIQTF